jgi:hypothetical protein
MAGSSLARYDTAKQEMPRMPVFGKSLFETVLDGMDVDEVDDDEEESFVHRPRVTPHFVADTSFADRAEQRPLGELYEDFGEPLPAEPALPPSPEPPEWLGRLSEQDVIDDLGLEPGMTRAEIRGRRRIFARGNHPDRVLEEFRDAATVRMTIANRLVEAALRRGL